MFFSLRKMWPRICLISIFLASASTRSYAATLPYDNDEMLVQVGPVGTVYYDDQLNLVEEGRSPLNPFNHHKDREEVSETQSIDDNMRYHEPDGTRTSARLPSAQTIQLVASLSPDRHETDQLIGLGWLAKIKSWALAWVSSWKFPAYVNDIKYCIVIG